MILVVVTREAKGSSDWQPSDEANLKLAAART